jgi:hypothetical protein
MAIVRNIVVMIIAIIAIPLASSAEPQLNYDSKYLAKCMNVFSYAANTFLIQDNEGAAKVMVLQNSRATALLFSMHYVDGRIPRE